MDLEEFYNKCRYDLNNSATLDEIKTIKSIHDMARAYSNGYFTLLGYGDHYRFYLGTTSQLLDSSSPSFFSDFMGEGSSIEYAVLDYIKKCGKKHTCPSCKHRF
jgi:hypothetical protein